MASEAKAETGQGSSGHAKQARSGLDGQIKFTSLYQNNCQALRQKIFCFRFSELCGCLRAVPRLTRRGASRSSRTLGAGCDGRWRPQLTSEAAADGEIAWSRSPDAGIKPAGDERAGD